MDPRAVAGWVRVGLVAAVLPWAACELDNPPYVMPGLGTEALEPELSPGAAIAGSWWDGLVRAGLAVWPLDDGGAAGLITSPAAWTVFRFSPDGEAHGFALGPAAQGVSVGDELFVADCPYQARFGVTDPVEGYVPLNLQLGPAATVSCGGYFGPGGTPHRVLQLASSNDVLVHDVDPATRTDVVDVVVAAPALPADSSFVWLFEPVVGTVTYVIVGPSGYALMDQLGSTTPLTGLEGDTWAGQLWIGDDGALRIVTAEGLYRWDAVARTATLVAAVPAPPAGTTWVAGGWRGGAFAEAGEPNPDAPDVSIPTAMAIRLSSDSGFDVVEPPLTPCCDPDACRQVGETYLIGGVVAGGEPLVVYDVWSWFGSDQQFTHLGVVRPVTDPCPGG